MRRRVANRSDFRVADVDCESVHFRVALTSWLLCGVLMGLIAAAGDLMIGSWMERIIVEGSRLGVVTLFILNLFGNCGVFSHT